MKNFALIGASGYIAPRHMKAIKDTNNNLIVALDKNDSIGIIDSYFPKADFFTEIERFDRHVQKLKYEKDIKIDYTAICSPNYLHDSHIRMSLRNGSDAICEKPLVLNPWNIGALERLENETGKKIWNVLQLRVHPAIIKLRDKIKNDKSNSKYDIDLTYLTSRGKWYHSSWKGDISKSGGVTTNIGVHFFDMLSWIFGNVQSNIVHVNTHDRAGGFIEFEKARVRWFLSINEDLIPSEIRSKGQKTYRSIKIQGEELEFSGGFEELHTLVYKDIISGSGFSLEDAKPAIEIISDIRNSSITKLTSDYHPLCKLKVNKHPFINE